MKIRAISCDDICQIKKIYETHYFKEFDMPNFYNGFMGAFAVVDDNEQIITIGGVRSIAESVILTDKSKSVEDRREALLHVLDFSKFLASTHNFDHLYAFINDENWLKHILKAGFRPINGLATILDLK